MRKSPVKFQGVYDFLHNDHPCHVTYQGITYPSVTHAFHASKLENNTTLCEKSGKSRRDLANMSLNLVNTYGARINETDEWKLSQNHIMSHLIHQKFKSLGLKQKLKSTGSLPLIHGNLDGDVYWGVDLKTKKGYNMLGKILEKERSNLV